jgi:hypothetical protein
MARERVMQVVVAAEDAIRHPGTSSGVEGGAYRAFAGASIAS